MSESEGEKKKKAQKENVCDKKETKLNRDARRRWNVIKVTSRYDRKKTNHNNRKKGEKKKMKDRRDKLGGKDTEVAHCEQNNERYAHNG